MGMMKSMANVIFAFCAAGMVWATAAGEQQAKPAVQTPLLCYIGGTMRPAMEKLVALYGTKTGVKIEVDYAESGTQLVKIKETRKGDLLVVHDPYEGATAKDGLLDKSWTAARLVGVIVVPKGNPKAIKTLADLTRPGVRVVLTDSVYSTLGHVVKVMARKSGLGKKLYANAVTMTKSSGEAANAVMLGTADAAIVWDAVAFLRREKLDAIPIDQTMMPVTGVDAITSATFGDIDMSNIRVLVMTLSCSKQQEKARAFAAFCASPEGAAVWSEMGYSAPIVRPAKAVTNVKISGNIFVYCAGGMRVAIDTIAKEFEKATGVKVERSFDASNKLLGQIELTKRGDVYIPGDADYVEMARAKGLVASEKNICWFVPVILVKKGDPKAIKTLSDLCKPGIRIGQGDPKAAAVGRIMPRLLALNTIDTVAWRKNVVLTAAMVGELANAVKLGTIDAAIVWNATAAAYPSDASVIAIDAGHNICPQVGGAVLSFAKNKDAAAAFLVFVTSDKGRAMLSAHGYTVDKP
jgi:molybdate transport system substrate-binding protein